MAENISRVHRNTGGKGGINTAKGDTWSTDAYERVKEDATDGGKKSLTSSAEERYHQSEELNLMVDPKGPPHLGALRSALPLFEKEGRYWLLRWGMPMAVETALDTSGSMARNVANAFESLPHLQEMLITGQNPILAGYHLNIATGIFNDLVDYPYKIPVICRTQFERDERIAIQMTDLVPGGGGGGNNKEDPQYLLFGGAYLTYALIYERYGTKTYHFTFSDEPSGTSIELGWLKKFYGANVLEQCADNGYKFDPHDLPDTAQIIEALQMKKHAFFLQVPGSYDRAVKKQWTELYGEEHFITLPDGTKYAHGVQAVIIGLTEGVIGLDNAQAFLEEHNIPKGMAKRIVDAVEHIPLAAQRLSPNYFNLPKPGSLFEERTDLWPVDPSQLDLIALTDETPDKTTSLKWL